MVLRQSLEDHLGERCRIYTAANGREAVECAQQQPTDLILMDIEMPGMDGLEASRRIAELHPHCKIVMLTAYSEFAYAREALALGASEYLLKPCPDEELHAMVDRMLDLIDARREQERQQQHSIHRIQTLTSHVGEQLVLTVMGGYISSEYVLSKLQELEIVFVNGVFAILHFAGDEGDVSMAVKTAIWPEGVHPISYLYDKKLYLLCISSKPQVDSVTATSEHFRRLAEAARTLLGKPLLGALGSGFTDIQQAQISYFQAQKALVQCSVQSPVCQCSRWNETGDSIDNPLLEGILVGNGETILQLASNTVHSFAALQMDWDTLVSRLEQILVRTVEALEQQLGIPLPVPQLQGHPKNDLNELVRSVAAIMEGLSKQIGGESNHSDGGNIRIARIKKEIEDYVAAHYHEDIFLPDIAREMHYSSPYFSKLFKQCFQRNFIVFLTEVRVAAAKNLLQHSTLTIREVGEQVGYKDPNYFTKVFRKTTGYSPSDFRLYNMAAPKA